MNLVKDFYNLSKKVLTKGEIGIEIEEEGRRLPNEVDGWSVVHDGSLNEFGREYVLSSPVKIEDVDKVLGDLKGAHLACKSEIHDTIRAGVHIHVNCQDLTMTQLHNFIITYLILEDLLVSYCGPSREGNLFCLRLKDAKALSRHIIDHLRSKNGFYHEEDVRYASINLTSLSKYGSLEFRAMRSTEDYSVISNWAHMLYNIKQFSRQFRDPKHIIESFSEGEYDIFARNALGAELYDELGKTPQEVQQMLKGCMRRSQGIAYATDWELYEEHCSQRCKKRAPREVPVWAQAWPQIQLAEQILDEPQIPDGLFDNHLEAQNVLLVRQLEGRRMLRDILEQRRDVPEVFRDPEVFREEPGEDEQ